ncbi:MAG TPA: NAD(+) diphosphatase [Solirubrobacteraceae bacterium]|nr:NAD(+) diphosphatase [Solirubrobacteraceae bacterium]
MSATSAFVPDTELPTGDGPGPRFYAVRGDRVLVHRNGGRVSFPDPPPQGDWLVLGRLKDTPYVAVTVGPDTPAGELVELDLRELYPLVSELEWSLASRAVQIVGWDRNHRFCGRCATATVPATGERSRVCPHCGLTAYPRLSPAIIVLITRGDREQEALLAWGRRAPTRRFSTLAGFVEVGEDLEDAVRREVREEVGLELDRIEYFGSQPWPFPHQLMVGFRARYASGEIVVQESEIVQARWFTADEVEAESTSRGPFSISGWLIDGWIAEQRGAGAPLGTVAVTPTVTGAGPQSSHAK